MAEVFRKIPKRVDVDKLAKQLCTYDMRDSLNSNINEATIECETISYNSRKNAILKSKKEKSYP